MGDKKIPKGPPIKIPVGGLILPVDVPPLLQADQVDVKLKTATSAIVVRGDKKSKASVEITSGSINLTSGETSASISPNMAVFNRRILLFNGQITAGGNGADGALIVRAKEQSFSPASPSSKPSAMLTGDAKFVLGGGGHDGTIQCLDKTGKVSIEIDANTGDIKLSGADCAENFQLRGVESVAPGTVLVIMDENGLAPCVEAYDSRVAGVVSGAGDLQPGIRLDSARSMQGRAPVALIGKVNCLVDASYGVISVGDLLTTSATTGHAMRADLARRAPGAILGKALRGLSSGRGLIPVLVALH